MSLADDITGDLGGIFDETDFAVEATINGRSLRVLWDRGFMGITTIGRVEIEAEAPTVICRSSDVEHAVHGDTIVLPVNGVMTDYKIIGIQPDNFGTTTLILQEV